MTDEELIARLRAYAQIAHAAAAWGFAGEGEVMSRSADRIAALLARAEAAEAALSAERETVARLTEALRRIANREIHEISMADVARAALTQKEPTDGE